MMKKGTFVTLLLIAFLPLSAWADINPTATYTNSSGMEVTVSDQVEGDAPLHVQFTANASSLDAGATLEWRFRHYGSSESNSEITRYEENPEYTFTQSGLTTATLYVRQDNELVDSATIRVTISESHLEMPNAFSPNGNDDNKTYHAKKNHKSIVEFHAVILNRWGQKLYEWDDVNGSWDGTFHGSPVKSGVYFVQVKARGADGRTFNIRRDVNLIRKFNDVNTTAEGGK